MSEMAPRNKTGKKVPKKGASKKSRPGEWVTLTSPDGKQTKRVFVYDK